VKKDPVYYQDKRNSALFELESISYEGPSAMYTFVNRQGDFKRIVNSYNHKHFIDYLIREKVTIGTKMLITINEANSVEYGEIADG
jgi:hypothetical protein